MPFFWLISTTMGQSLGCRDATEIWSLALDNVSKRMSLGVHMNGISVFQHSSLSTLKSFIILLRAFAMAPNEFIIRAAKDASAFTGLMNCNPALIVRRCRGRTT
jgi:hypothetical protein